MGTVRYLVGDIARAELTSWLVRQPDQVTGDPSPEDQIWALVGPLVRQPDQPAKEAAARDRVRALIRCLVREPDRAWAEGGKR